MQATCQHFRGSDSRKTRFANRWPILSALPAAGLVAGLCQVGIFAAMLNSDWEKIKPRLLPQDEALAGALYERKDEGASDGLITVGATPHNSVRIKNR